MSDAQFTFWPWKILAVLVPLVAIGAGILYQQSPNSDPLFLGPVVLGMLAAGNAYVIAIAGGNLARTALAVPVGAAAGFLPSLALLVPVLLVMYGFFLLGWIGLNAFQLLLKRSQSAGPLSALGLGCLLVIGGGGGSLLLLALLHSLAGWGPQAMHLMLVPLCYPMVCACVAACMINNTRYKGAVEGFFDSITASLRGLLIGAVLCLPVAVLVGVSTSLTNLSGHVRELICAGLLLAICNYAFMANFFSAIMRVTPPAQPQASEPPPDSAGQDQSSAQDATQK